MPKKSKKTGGEKTTDIYRLLSEASEKKRQKERTELLQAVGVEDKFEKGDITIDMKTCKGVECKFCIDVCPTNALYWKTGEVCIIKELCIYCTSCVLNCMVDNCIEVRRKRQNGETEVFCKPQDVSLLLNRINARNRVRIIKDLFPDDEAYLKRYGKHARARLKKEEEKEQSS